jgi:hypothetical protein
LTTRRQALEWYKEEITKRLKDDIFRDWTPNE